MSIEIIVDDEVHEAPVARSNERLREFLQSVTGIILDNRFDSYSDLELMEYVLLVQNPPLVIRQ